jgi:hypothetical protein
MLLILSLSKDALLLVQAAFFLSRSEATWQSMRSRLRGDTVWIATPPDGGSQ